MRVLQALILLAFLGAVGLFCVQNTGKVQVRFGQWGVASSLALIIVAVYLLGMLSGWTVVAFLRRSIRRISEDRRR
jgi:uncharacterized integral membrane protein